MPVYWRQILLIHVSRPEMNANLLIAWLCLSSNFKLLLAWKLFEEKIMILREKILFFMNFVGASLIKLR